MNDMVKMHTIRQVAKMTGLSEYFLRKSIRDGVIPVIQCGNRAKLSVSMTMDALGIKTTAHVDNNR